MILEPSKMRKAGEVLDQMSLTDTELDEAIQALDLVIPFLEGAGFSKWVLGPLRVQRDTFESFQRARKKLRQETIRRTNGLHE